MKTTKDLIATYIEKKGHLIMPLPEFVEHVRDYGIINGIYRSAETIARDFRKIRENGIKLDFNPFNTPVVNALHCQYKAVSFHFGKLKANSDYDFIEIKSL